ncbi:MAG: acyl-CoA thioesterase [Alistipes sp.]
MGFVHHSNYVRYYETARTEMLRELGMTYPQLEAQGIMLPVIDVQSRYVSPAFDDDLLTVRVTLAEMPKVKMRFDYEVFRENGERINAGSVTLAFMNAATRRPVGLPARFWSGWSLIFSRADRFRAARAVKRDGRRRYGRSFRACLCGRAPAVRLTLQ